MRSLETRLRRLEGHAQTLRAGRLLDELLGGSFFLDHAEGDPERFIAKNGRIYTLEELEGVRAQLLAAGEQNVFFVILDGGDYDPTLPNDPQPPEVDDGR